MASNLQIGVMLLLLLVLVFSLGWQACDFFKEIKKIKADQKDSKIKNSNK